MEKSPDFSPSNLWKDPGKNLVRFLDKIWREESVDSRKNPEQHSEGRSIGVDRPGAQRKVVRLTFL